MIIYLIVPWINPQNLNQKVAGLVTSTLSTNVEEKPILAVANNPVIIQFKRDELPKQFLFIILANLNN